MICPECGGKTKTPDSVHVKDRNEKYRKRACLDCGKVFFTAETIVEDNQIFRNRWNRHHRLTAFHERQRTKEQC